MYNVFSRICNFYVGQAKRSKSYFICMWAMLLSFGLQAQKMKSSYSKFQQEYSIEDAKKLMQKDPQQAVVILNEIINNGKRKPQVVSEAYELLGDINVLNELFPQSIDRYQRALELLSSRKESTGKANLNYKIAKSFLEVSPADAASYFTNCMEIGSKNLYTLCYEGLADVYSETDSLDKALEIYSKIESGLRKRDKEDLSRIQAKIAAIYAEQNQIPEALNSYNQSQSNFDPKVNRNNKSLKKAADKIVSNQNSVNDEIKLRSSNIESYGSDVSLVAEERIQLASAYVKSGKADLALLELKELKPTVSDLAEDIKADYFKKTAEVFTLQGDYKAALENFENYEISRNKVLNLREEDLNNRLIINDLQSFVDLSEKDNVIKKDRNTYNENISKSKNWIIYLLISLLLGSLIAAFLIFRNVQAKKKANKLLELRSLRSEMNPHFIFNALGSVNEYIATKDPRKANRFLADFSTLMRSAMEMNKKDLIPLHEELAFSELYLKLEHARWAEKFSFDIQWDLDSLDSELRIPPLLVQPYIENAIWHGLRYKEDKGHLLFQVKQLDKMVQIIIEDDGIGRGKSRELKTKNQKKYASTGLKNTNKRATLINELYEKRLSISIQDLYTEKEDKGTQVIISVS